MIVFNDNKWYLVSPIVNGDWDAVKKNMDKRWISKFRRRIS